MTVFDLKKGEEGKVLNVYASGGAAARLASLGLKRGTTVRVLAFSLFKSSVLVEFGAVKLGIRKRLALCIEVKK